MLLVHLSKPLSECGPTIFPDLKVLARADMGCKVVAVLHAEWEADPSSHPSRQQCHSPLQDD